jgi:hypothetical protein
MGKGAWREANVMRIVGAAVLAAGLSGAAEAQMKPFIDGNMLLERCRQTRGTYDFGYCNGYVTGIADLLANTNPVNGFRACIPPTAMLGQLRDTVVTWLDRHPQHRHNPADILVPTALSEAFPCR